MSYLNNYMNYGSYGYTPIQRPYQQNITPAQPIQPQAPTPQYSQPAPTLGADFPIRFANIEEAKAFAVFPNQRQFFINNEKSELYIKSADGMGQSFFDEYVITPKGKTAPTVSIEPENTDDLVKKDDIKDFVSKEYISALENQINTLNSKVEKALRLGELITPTKKTGGKE